MWTDNAVIEALEAYTEGRMSGAERDAFEQRLRTDTDLAEQLTCYRETRKAIEQHHADEHVRALLQRTEANAEHAMSGWRKWAAAAAVIIALGAAWWLVVRPPGLPALADEFDVRESPLPVFMSAEQDPHVTLDEAMQAYGAGDYATAIQKLALLPPSDTALFFTGIAQQRLGHDAGTALRAVAQQADSRYRDKAAYHLLLGALRADDRTLAQRLWKEQMAATGHPYRAQLEALGERAGWKR